ncbi:hypothetical protein [Nocardioides sp. SYSU D00038]|uniref:hypothetical protein n=1 Tax=Nocardioides sp. SYSU D00038 TaxID=2812554 RepID=UPI0019671444|nr:hypothetical protein [Nocardioides sp. SYSU D00038]
MSTDQPRPDADAGPTEGIDDEQLPDDLRPGEDNPLAEGLPPGETAGDLLEDGKPAEQDADDASDEADTPDHQG